MSSNKNYSNCRFHHCTAKDIQEVRAIGIKTFSESYGRLNTEKDMRSYLSKAFSYERMKTELENKESSFYLLKRGKDVLGYIKINFGASRTGHNKKNCVELERMYLLKEHQGKGLGRLLLKKTMEIAAENKIDCTWLGVWSKNPDAIRFYEKNGFVKNGTRIFILGKDRQIDCIMRKNISLS